VPPPPPNPPPPPAFVSRGGLKLHHALTHFNLPVTGLTAADFGCSTGGFTHCLLHHGAARVYALDTGYGVLAWALRNDPRVVVMERSSVLHTPPHPETAPHRGVDLVVIDAGWTPQRLVLPAALRWLKPNPPTQLTPPAPTPENPSPPSDSPFCNFAILPFCNLPPTPPPPPLILTLIKPHYELTPDEKHLLHAGPRPGVLADDQAERIHQRTLAALPALGLRLLNVTESPIRGQLGKHSSAKAADGTKGGGNREWLALLARA